MKIIFAIDIKNGLIVHGKSGNRDTYVPISGPDVPTAEPVSYITYLRPKYLYVADLDRINKEGDHTETVMNLAPLTAGLYVDRGSTIPEEYLPSPITTIVGTETMDAPMEEFTGGFLSIDIKNGVVIPSGEKPEEVLKSADKSRFDGAIILNISQVGTGCGIDQTFIEIMRKTTGKPLYYGGGVATIADLELLKETGFDGAIISTAVFSGAIPKEMVQRGEF